MRSLLFDGKSALYELDPSSLFRVFEAALRGALEAEGEYLAGEAIRPLSPSPRKTLKVPGEGAVPARSRA